MPYVSIAISGIALFVAGISLWRSYLAPMHLLVAAGPLTLRIKQFGPTPSPKCEIWFVADVSIDIVFTNAGARPGMVRDLRLRIDYPGLPIPDAHEYCELSAEVDPKEFNKSPSRPAWLKRAILNAGAPFILLPRETQSKRLIFTVRWDKPINQTYVSFQLQAFTDRSKKWLTYETWKTRLRSDSWDNFIEGVATASYPDGYRTRISGNSSPPNLHDYTRTPSGIEPDDLGWDYIVDRNPD
jgi:hypothetical protein